MRDGVRIVSPSQHKRAYRGLFLFWEGNKMDDIVFLALSNWILWLFAMWVYFGGDDDGRR